MYTFQEFFAGGGMVRAGLGKNWSCEFANEISELKCEVYEANWGGDELNREDISDLKVDQIEGAVDMAWASFPCQDLSIAGNGVGLAGKRSKLVWKFLDLITGRTKTTDRPRLIILENVVGTLGSKKGKDFRTICKALAELEYKVGALVLDAAQFLPHSRKRLFIVAVRNDLQIPDQCSLPSADPVIHPKKLIDAHSRLPRIVKNDWVWWNVSSDFVQRPTLAELIEENVPDTKWHTPEQTRHLVDLMSDAHRKKVRATGIGRDCLIGTLYRRMRKEDSEKMVQRAEVRFDGIAGCLRTPRGGSSKQILLFRSEKKIRSRAMTPRETARLMGLPESFKLPKSDNAAYQLTGDGVAVPVVSHLAREILEPVLSTN